MEYPATDFYLKFKIILNSVGKFMDFVLTYVSDGFYEITKMDPAQLLGKSFSEIVVDNADKLYFKEIYLTMIPNKKQKIEAYIEELGCWYFIDIFFNNGKGEEQDYVTVYYVDITNIKKDIPQETDSSNISREIISLTEKNRHSKKSRLTDSDKKHSLEELLGLGGDASTDCKNRDSNTELRKTK